MSAERVLVSYIVRVAVRDGRRGIRVHQVGSDETRVFGSYGELVDFLGHHESALGRLARSGRGVSEDPGSDAPGGAES